MTNVMCCDTHHLACALCIRKMTCEVYLCTPKRRRVVHAIRDAALLPRVAPIWDTDWVGVLPASITADDVCHWPYSVGILVTFVAFFGTFSWPASGADSLRSCSFCMSFGLERGVSWKKLSLAISELVVHFQCQLFLLVQPLMFGAPAASLVV